MKSSFLRLLIITVVFALGLAFHPCARADTIQVRGDAPDRYVVVKGDTLWAISGRFLSQPWRWPEIWNLNRSQIKDPHWIYPGDVVVLDRSHNPPRLSLERGGESVQPSAGSAEHPTVRLSPEARGKQNKDAAIPAIPLADIRPFLTRPLVVDRQDIAAGPRIIATDEHRLDLGTGELAYVAGLAPDTGKIWQVYRPGKALKDPDTGELLGYEAEYIADVQVTRGGDPTTVSVVRQALEVNKGDRLLPPPPEEFAPFVPHAPDHEMAGRILGTSGGISEVGRGSVISLNRGTRDGVEVGHVLASYRLGDVIRETPDSPPVKLPNERTGLVFVFRTFDRVSYALVMQSERPLHVNDIVKTP